MSYLDRAIRSLRADGCRVRRIGLISGHDAAVARWDDGAILLIGGDAPVAFDLGVVSLARVRANAAAFGAGDEDEDEVSAAAWARIEHAEMPWPV